MCPHPFQYTPRDILKNKGYLIYPYPSRRWWQVVVVVVVKEIEGQCTGTTEQFFTRTWSSTSLMENTEKMAKKCLHGYRNAHLNIVLWQFV